MSLFYDENAYEQCLIELFRIPWAGIIVMGPM
jgi:hypothetical protein